jgi:hypothetical protein
MSLRGTVTLRADLGGLLAIACCLGAAPHVAGAPLPAHGQMKLGKEIDRAVVDGRGRVVAELGEHEARVAALLRWGTSKKTLATQAIPLDLCGDARQELVLYQPYRGTAIMIFTQPDGSGAAKPYVHQRNAYNMRTYF